MSLEQTHRSIETVWKIEAPKLIAGLARIVRDIGVAEDLAQDALVAALEQWPSEGVPRNPAAWLMATAKHRAIDRLRRNAMLDRKHEELERELDKTGQSTLQPNQSPAGVYSTDSADQDFGDDWMRPALCEDALRLGRILAELTPEEPEVHGLVALMEIQASRPRARVGPAGEPILLLEQNRARWDRLLIGRGLAALERAERLGGARGPYALQAAIAACHARALTPDATDWARIAALYALHAETTPSPVIELNRAVAVSMAFSPAAGLEIVESLSSEPSLENYHLLQTVRGDLLQRLGRVDEARGEFERAAALTRNERERAVLLARAAACGAGIRPNPTEAARLRSGSAE